MSDVLAAGGLIIRPPWTTFEEAVDGLVESLVRNGQITDDLHQLAVRAICEREKMASTAIVEIGVSIPHARLDGIDGVVAAIAGSPTAVYYAMTSVPITVMALVLSGPSLAGEHLNFIAALSMLLQSDAVRRELRHAEDTTAALSLLRAQRGA